eukprot:3412291-Alexandrium_andersonii.AAC.1
MPQPTSEGLAAQAGAGLRQSNGKRRGPAAGRTLGSARRPSQRVPSHPSWARARSITEGEPNAGARAGSRGREVQA